MPNSNKPADSTPAPQPPRPQPPRPITEGEDPPTYGPRPPKKD